MLLLSPKKFTDYELIDCGDFLKLERFGKIITIRPEPQAVWSSTLNYNEWLKIADVVFEAKSSSSGTWKKQKNVADSWMIKYHIDSIDKTIDFRLALTSFKHVGVFPEQAVNWEYIGEGLKKIKNDKKNFLNLFAYTGGASLAAKAAGADTTHVDSIKQVVTWANSNMEISKLNHIRWVVEDALKFVKREVKRGNTYHGIILDPPAYGHGPNGEKWKLEDNINEMIQLVLQLLNPQEHFLILNAYSLGFSGIILENLLNTHLVKFPKAKIETGELFLQSTHKNKLPLGVFGRVELFKK